MYSYHFREWLSFFYFYCIFGWCFESAYVSIKEQRLTNRGFLRGPWLPLSENTSSGVCCGGFGGYGAGICDRCDDGTVVPGPLLGLQRPEVSVSGAYLPELFCRMGIFKSAHGLCSTQAGGTADLLDA